jgi:hypothetical protein
MLLWTYIIAPKSQNVLVGRQEAEVITSLSYAYVTMGLTSNFLVGSSAFLASIFQGHPELSVLGSKQGVIYPCSLGRA